MNERTLVLAALSLVGCAATQRAATAAAPQHECVFDTPGIPDLDKVMFGSGGFAYVLESADPTAKTHATLRPMRDGVELEFELAGQGVTVVGHVLTSSTPLVTTRRAFEWPEGVLLETGAPLEVHFAADGVHVAPAPYVWHTASVPRTLDAVARCEDLALGRQLASFDDAATLTKRFGGTPRKVRFGVHLPIDLLDAPRGKVLASLSASEFEDEGWLLATKDGFARVALTAWHRSWWVGWVDESALADEPVRRPVVSGAGSSGSGLGEWSGGKTRVERPAHERRACPQPLPLYLLDHRWPDRREEVGSVAAGTPLEVIRVEAGVAQVGLPVSWLRPDNTESFGVPESIASCPIVTPP